MTNEQRVRVDRLERYLITDREKTYTTVRVNDLDTVLSLIKEQQEKIEKKDKIIDLMAEFINKVWCDYPGSIFKKLKDDGFNTNECSNCVGKVCKNCIKQYFERKVEDVKD